MKKTWHAITGRSPCRNQSNQITFAKRSHRKITYYLKVNLSLVNPSKSHQWHLTICQNIFDSKKGCFILTKAIC